MKRIKEDYTFTLGCGGVMIFYFFGLIGLIAFLLDGSVFGFYSFLYSSIICIGGIMLAIISGKIYDKREAEEDRQTYKYYIEVELTHDHKHWEAGKKYEFKPSYSYFYRRGCFDKFIVKMKDTFWGPALKCPIPIIKNVKVTLLGSDENIYDDLLQEHLDWIAKHSEAFKDKCNQASFFEKFYKNAIKGEIS